MDFGLTEEQQQLKESARDFLAKECTTAEVREAMASEDGMGRDLWNEISKLGWNGLVIPEKYGGSGLGTLDMALLLEEGGYAAMPGPFLFSSMLAASILSNAGSDPVKSKWLGALARGSAIGTVAIVEESDSLNPRELTTRAKHEGSGFKLSGAKMFAPYANVADFVIVAARTGEEPDDVALFVVETGARGVSVRLMQNLDLTRRVARVELDGVSVAGDAGLSGGVESLSRLLDLGAVAVAADSLGGTERSLDMAVEYSKVREQFGKPIGSFQALKHLAAEIVADLEPARALLWYAAYAQDALPDEAGRAASIAKALLSDVFSVASDRSVLMHGGIGFTWEHDIHLWFKRARFNESYFGSPSFHRERVAELGGY